MGALDVFMQDKGNFVIANLSLLGFSVPFILHLAQIKVSFSLTDYQTYLWYVALAYVLVTYSYVCDRIQDLFMFVIIYTIQIHSCLFFYLQNIYPLTPLQKIVMTLYLASICLFMNLMIREYNNTKRKNKDKTNLVQTKLVFFVNQCSGTIFAQILFIVIGIIDFKHFDKIFKLSYLDLVIYAAFSLLSLFGFCTGIFILLFRREKLKKNSYSMQIHWFYFTGLLAIFCFQVMKWNDTFIFEQYILLLSFFFYFVFTIDQECETWFLIISLILGSGQIAIQVFFWKQFHDIWIYICSVLNNVLLLYQICYKIKEYFSDKNKKK